MCYENGYMSELSNATKITERRENIMKILIVGYGSMGKRRIRLSRKLYLNAEYICVDNNEERIHEIIKNGHKAFRSLEDAIADKPNVAFVCTSPGQHADIIMKLVSAGIDTFTELNLVSDRYEEIIQLAEQNDVHVFMSSTMLYDAQIVAIENEIKKSNDSLTYIYHVGQYLPDWHPWESYKDFFVGKKETNGCREIYAIQLPWILDAFGPVKSVTSLSKKATNLDIDYCDTYITVFEHENGTHGVMIVDVLARQATTYFEVMGEHLHIKWNGSLESLQSFDLVSGKMKKLDSYDELEHMEGYADNINENEYLDEIKAFFNWIEKGMEPRYTLEDDKYTLGLIDEIEEIK